MMCYANNILKNYLFVSLLLLIVACSDPNVNHTLKQSGKNRIELEQFLSYYAQDAEKVKAAKFFGCRYEK